MSRDGARAPRAGDPDTHHRHPVATLPNISIAAARGVVGLGKVRCLVALPPSGDRSGAPPVGARPYKVLLMSRGWIPLQMERWHLSLARVVRLTDETDPWSQANGISVA